MLSFTTPSEDVSVPPAGPNCLPATGPLDTPTGRTRGCTGTGFSGVSLFSFLQAVPASSSAAKARLIHLVSLGFIRFILRKMPDVQKEKDVYMRQLAVCRDELKKGGEALISCQKECLQKKNGAIATSNFLTKRKGVACRVVCTYLCAASQCCGIVYGPFLRSSLIAQLRAASSVSVFVSDNVVKCVFSNSLKHVL